MKRGAGGITVAGIGPDEWTLCEQAHSPAVRLLSAN